MSLAAYAGDVRTVVFKTKPEMHCENCENKIKNNLRFEKGVKDIKTDLKKKEVTIKYDSDKTNVKNLIAGFSKINYEATAQNNPDKEKQKEQRKEEKKAEKKEQKAEKKAEKKEQKAEKKAEEKAQKRAEKQSRQKEMQQGDHAVDGTSAATSK